MTETKTKTKTKSRWNDSTVPGFPRKLYPQHLTQGAIVRISRMVCFENKEDDLRTVHGVSANGLQSWVFHTGRVGRIEGLDDSINLDHIVEITKPGKGPVKEKESSVQDRINELNRIFEMTLRDSTRTHYICYGLDMAVRYELRKLMVAHPHWEGYLDTDLLVQEVERQTWVKKEPVHGGMFVRHSFSKTKLRRFLRQRRNSFLKNLVKVQEEYDRELELAEYEESDLDRDLIDNVDNDGDDGSDYDDYPLYDYDDLWKKCYIAPSVASRTDHLNRMVDDRVECVDSPFLVTLAWWIVDIPPEWFKEYRDDTDFGGYSDVSFNQYGIHAVNGTTYVMNDFGDLVPSIDPYHLEILYGVFEAQNDSGLSSFEGFSTLVEVL